MTGRIRSGIVVLAALTASAVACDEGGSTGPSTGTVAVTVTAGAEPVAGVTVELFPEGSEVAESSSATDASGEAVFGDLEPGTYAVEITVPTGFVVASDGPTRQTVEVTAGDRASASYSLAEDAEAGPVEEVRLTNFAFTPADLTIEPGTTVRWINDTNTFHTVTPNGHAEWSEWSTDASGETFEHTFDTVGQFPYYCSPHRSQGMTGTVTVEAP